MLDELVLFCKGGFCCVKCDKSLGWFFEVVFLVVDTIIALKQYYRLFDTLDILSFRMRLENQPLLPGHLLPMHDLYLIYTRDEESSG